MTTKEDLKFIIEHSKDLAYLNLDWDLVRKLMQTNEHPLKKRTFRPDIDLLKIVRDPNNFHFTCKHILNKDILPYQNVVLRELWRRPFPLLLGSRGAAKTFMLAVYCVLRALINQGCNIAITGAAFRQAKIVFEYIEQLWSSAPVLRDLVGNDRRAGSHHDSDRWWFGIGESTIFAIPIGTGDKIRGYRANYLISDEFSAQNPDIYENVIAGFSFVSSNPIEKVKEAAQIQLLKNMKMWTPEQDERLAQNYKGNQSILAGTTNYRWNHFYRYFMRYKGIVESKGDKNKLAEVLGEEPDDRFDWRDYSVIRLPLELIPQGFMEEKQVVRSKHTAHTSIHLMEFHAIWPNDSDGFFRRLLIESCVCGPGKITKADGLVEFKATVNGNPMCQYVYGIDPAAESDKFAIVILELHKDHSRVVYSWTTDKEDHRAKLKKGAAKESEFYGYVARKIRTLMQTFPCTHIAMDAMGGGGAVMEALRQKETLREGEQPILLITPEHPLSDKKERECDGEEGLHIVELVYFAKAEWTGGANHGMKKDFEEKSLLFPYFDPLEVSFASEADLLAGREYDRLEDCVLEIEELKDELASIVQTQTPTGREHWDTPEIKLSGSKKGRLRKDRYSALLMANAAARTLIRFVQPVYNSPTGGFVGTVGKHTGGKLYVGPAWFTTPMDQSVYGASVSRSFRE